MTPTWLLDLFLLAGALQAALAVAPLQQSGNILKPQDVNQHALGLFATHYNSEGLNGSE